MTPVQHPTGWTEWNAVAAHFGQRLDGLHEARHFAFQVPLSVQGGLPRRFRKPYTVPVHYTCWQPPDPLPGLPTLLCVGGVANTAARFSFLAADLQRAGQRVVCMDWVGRGLSGWLAEGSEYQRPVYVEQLRQMIEHLAQGQTGARAESVALLGSSMGGTAAITLAAQHPGLVARLVLNDVGPEMPRARRRRRAETLARWYVFRTPAEIMRRVGAAQKNDGPVDEHVRWYFTWHQTRWSDEDHGRVYRHDPRAMLAFRRDAQVPLRQWGEWSRVACPTLLLHGLQSDALTPAILRRMGQSRAHGAPAPLLAHIPHTGHTPALSCRHQTALIAEWLRGGLSGAQALCVPQAPLRQPAAALQHA